MREEIDALPILCRGPGPKKILEKETVRWGSPRAYAVPSDAVTGLSRSYVRE